MAVFEINDIQGFIDACTNINNNVPSGEDIVININKDIDFNDISKYWIIEDHMFQMRCYNSDINIYGNGHSIKNVYIVNGSLFKFNFINNGSSENNVYIYDLDFDFVINKNPIDTSILAFLYSGFSANYINTTAVTFTNCTFRAKLFVASPRSDVSNRNVCSTLFNIEYYRIHKMNNNNDCLTLSYEGSGLFPTLTNCQFYIKTYLVDSTTSGEYSSREFFAHCNINNCFFIIEVCANNSTVPFLFSDNYTTFYNSYIVLKKSSTASISPNMKLLISSSSNSSVNNFICDADTSSGTQIDAPADYFKTISSSNAKNANFLLSNVGFIIKA